MPRGSRAWAAAFASSAAALARQNPSAPRDAQGGSRAPSTSGSSWSAGHAPALPSMAVDAASPRRSLFRPYGEAADPSNFGSHQELYEARMDQLRQRVKEPQLQVRGMGAARPAGTGRCCCTAATHLRASPAQAVPAPNHGRRRVWCPPAGAAHAPHDQAAGGAGRVVDQCRRQPHLPRHHRWGCACAGRQGHAPTRQGGVDGRQAVMCAPLRTRLPHRTPPQAVADTGIRRGQQGGCAALLPACPHKHTAAVQLSPPPPPLPARLQTTPWRSTQRCSSPAAGASWCCTGCSRTSG